MDLKINLSTLNSDEIIIPIGKLQSFYPTGQSDLNESFLDSKEENLVEANKIDLEKINYKPSNSFSKYNIELLNVGGGYMSYADFLYTNDDLLYQRNRFKNSFLLFDFFDSPVPTNQKRLLQISIYNQLTESNYDINGNLLDVSNIPMVFSIVDPKKRSVKSNYEGFYIFWYKNPPYESLPKNLYCYTSYYNSVNGQITPLISYGSAISLNDYFAFNYIKYRLNSDYTYTIDFTDRDINISSGILNINLYKPVFA